ncbi:AMP-binding protein [Phenylobacterium terrae]|uniref:AMP-binding protein n=1 Tax=Phenylobacterium terrae TaxID=2665495 RepID=A0ABW4MWG1_9CAUL
MTAQVPQDAGADLGWLARDPISRQAALRPTTTALRDLTTGRALAYADLETEVRRGEALLRSLVSPGARVAVLARNSVHHVSLFYACPRAGAVFVPLNWRLSGPELAVLVEDSAPEVIVYAAEFEPQLMQALEGRAQPRLFRIGETDAFADALAAARPAAPSPIDPLAPAMLLYTSGTTGRPKGVIVTPKTAFYSAMNYTFVGELTAGHAQLCDVPLFHVVGLLAVMHGSLLAGATVNLTAAFQPDLTARRLADPDLAITHYFCVPQMVQSLLDAPAFDPAACRGLKFFTGGAPMPDHLTLALAEAGIRPSNGYGMSENGTILGMPLDPALARTKLGSVGVPSPAVEIRIVGPDGRDAPDGEVGEIWLSGPSVTPGYWNQPEATAKTFSGRWFRTGDAARRDADGFYFIVDRWKDMYISGGENVYPAEVEAVLIAHEAVAEAAVVGCPDERWGECGCAFVVLAPGAALTEADLLAWCDARLARYKRPARIRFVEALPRTASGKIQKDILRRTLAAPQTEYSS